MRKKRLTIYIGMDALQHVDSIRRESPDIPSRSSVIEDAVKSYKKK